MELTTVHKLAVFLLAVIGSIEGRQIKSVSKNEDHEPIGAPVHIPNAAHHSVLSGKKEVLPPPTPTKSSDIGDSVTGYADDFRPTTPGNSPGVGHSFAEGDEDIEQEPAAGSMRSSNANDKHSNIAGDKDDFRPTNPGHSPGVGHAFLSKKTEPNA